MHDPELTNDVAARQHIEAVTPIDRQRAAEGNADRPRSPAASRLLSFLEELRRRRVCRALTMYAVALWLISQVVDLAYEQLGLPDWTLRLVLILGLAGLPVALLLSWLLDLNPDGVVVDAARNGRNSRPTETDGRSTIDCVLLFAAIAIAAQLAWAGLAGPSPEVLPAHKRIAVAPFRVGSGDDAQALSQSLTTDLQHELASRTGFRVVASRELFTTEDCLTLTGSVTSDADGIRITAALVDNESLEVIWTDVIRRERTATLVATAEIARDLVSLLQRRALQQTGDSHGD